MCEKLDKLQRYNELKAKTDEVIKSKEYVRRKTEYIRNKARTELDEAPPDGRLYGLCAKANFKLGYLIVAENLCY